MRGIKDFSLAISKGFLLKNASSYIMEKVACKNKKYF